MPENTSSRFPAWQKHLLWLILGVLLICALPLVVLMVPNESRLSWQLRSRGFEFIYNSDGGIWSYPTHFTCRRGCRVDNNTLGALGGMPHIYSMTFERADVGKLNFEKFAKISGLTHLTFIEASSLSPTEVPKLAGCVKLKSLFISHVALSRLEIEPLGVCPLDALILSNASLTNDEIEVISTFSRMDWLVLSDNPGITDEGLEHLKKLPALRVLDLMKTGVTEQGIEDFQKHRPGVKIRCDFKNEVDTMHR